MRIHPAQEPRGRLPALVGEQFHVRHARRAVDGGVDDRPSRPAGARPAIAGHPVSRPADDASEFLRVDVDQVAGPRPLVAGGGRGRHPGPAETQAHDRPVDGDRLLLRRGERHPGAPGAPGPAGPVRQPRQALTGEPLPPVGVRRPRDAGIGARNGHRRPRGDHVQPPSAPVRARAWSIWRAGKSVASEGLPGGCGVSTQHRTGRGLHPVPPSPGKHCHERRQLGRPYTGHVFRPIAECRTHHRAIPS